MMNILVSACLLGTQCRYSGDGKLDEQIKELMQYHHLVPICPEQLGGMPTPRAASEIKDGRVINHAGEDVTEYFERGAEEVLKLQQLFQCPFAILKERSPSCGSRNIYDGSFQGRLVSGDGITAGLLKRHGCFVLGESACECLLHMEKTGLILETERLLLRRLTYTDFGNLCTILQDEAVMYAYEHAFSDEEVHVWLERQIQRYAENGFGLWGVIEKATGDFIGQCGITMQNTQEGVVPEIGYLFAKAYWHQGFAVEAAKACRELAFDVYHMPDIYSIIRENNTASRHVAERNGMAVRGSYMKHYYGVDMLHLVYGVSCLSD